jgi:hypothetical protein
MKNRYLRIENKPGHRSGLTDALRRAMPGQRVRVPASMGERSVRVLASRARASISLRRTSRGLEIIKVRDVVDEG